MANLYLRKDSLGLINTSTLPTTHASKIRRKPVPGDSATTEEHGKRVGRDAFPKNLHKHLGESPQVGTYQKQTTENNVDEVVDLYASNHHRSRFLPHQVTPNSTTTTSAGPPSSRKERRKSRRATSEPQIPAPLPSTPTRPTHSATPSIDRTSWDLIMSRPTSLLICSLGNPPPYHSTRHSAAHIVLKALQSSLALPMFTQKSKTYGGGHVSVGTDYTLYQSAVQMNVSGPPLLKAWKEFCRICDVQNRNTGLVVLHDEMEINPGQFKVRRGNASARGHNGIKSVQSSLQGAGLLVPLGDRFVKIGVGIGRPQGGSRDPRDVTAFVLGQLTRPEKDGLEAGAGEVQRLLWAELARIGQSG